MSISRQQKERRQNQIISIPENIDELKPSCFMKKLSDAPKGIVAFMMARVSSEKQVHDGNLKRQENALIAQIEKHAKAKIKRIVRCQRSVKPDKAIDHLELVFQQMVKERVKSLIAMTTSRLIRSDNHNAITDEGRNQKPNKQELLRLKELAEKYEVDLYTVADPDLSPTEDSAFISNAIRENEGKTKAGRPKKKEDGYKTKQKEEWFAEVCRLYHQNRWSTRRIAKHVTIESGVKISHETVNQWIKESML